MDYRDLKKLSKNELISIIEDWSEEIEKNLDIEDTYCNLHSTRESIKLVFGIIWKIISSIAIVAAITVLVSNLVTPVMRVYGTSMEPILRKGDMLIAFKNEDSINRGDIVAFYYNNKVLLKRAIGLGGDEVSIDKNGSVSVNGKVIDEPYVSGKSLGECDVEFPMKIPEGSIFVLGDHRSVSVDSRSSEIGNIKNERIVGKVVLRIWPLDEIGKVQ